MDTNAAALVFDTRTRAFCSHGAMRRFLRRATGACLQGNRSFQFDKEMIQFRRFAMKKLKFVVEKHRDGYVAYPLGLKGAVVGQGESYESALADAKSAAAFHIESFGKEAFDDQDDVMEAFVTEASVTAG
jgi:predicted RNase H-like HicB family nuclease